MSHMTSL